MQQIELDRETHIYSPNLPNVSTILQKAGLIDPTWFTEESRQRGSALHLAAEYYDRGTLVFDDLDPQIAAYLRGFIQFRNNGHPLAANEWIETPLMDPLRLYAGTPDRILINRPRAIWDLKSGDYKPADKWQLASYTNMLEEPESYRRFCLYLRPNGTYRVREFPQQEYADDLNVFFAALTIYYARLRERI
jgi:hypothetical protein